MCRQDMNEATMRKFVINDSPVFEGTLVGKQANGEFDHFIVNRATMEKIHQFIINDGDLHEIPDANSDGLYDLWDYPTVSV